MSRYFDKTATDQQILAACHEWINSPELNANELLTEIWEAMDHRLSALSPRRHDDLPARLRELAELMKATPLEEGTAQLKAIFGDDPFLIADFIKLHRRIAALSQPSQPEGA